MKRRESINYDDAIQLKQLTKFCAMTSAVRVSAAAVITMMGERALLHRCRRLSIDIRVFVYCLLLRCTMCVFTTSACLSSIALLSLKKPVFVPFSISISIKSSEPIIRLLSPDYFSLAAAASVVWWRRLSVSVCGKNPEAP